MLRLDAIEAGKYFAEGSYGISESAVGMPLEARFSVESFPNSLVLDGEWFQHNGRPIHGFRVELARDELSQSQVSAIVRAPGLGDLTGRMSLRGPTLELLVADPANGHQLSARLVPLEKSHIYEVSGVIVVRGALWYPFHLRVMPGDAQLAESQVIALPKRSA